MRPVGGEGAPILALPSGGSVNGRRGGSSEVGGSQGPPTTYFRQKKSGRCESTAFPSVAASITLRGEDEQEKPTDPVGFLVRLTHNCESGRRASSDSPVRLAPGLSPGVTPPKLFPSQCLAVVFPGLPPRVRHGGKQKRKDQQDWLPTKRWDARFGLGFSFSPTFHRDREELGKSPRGHAESASAGGADGEPMSSERGL